MFVVFGEIFVKEFLFVSLGRYFCKRVFVCILGEHEVTCFLCELKFTFL